MPALHSHCRPFFDSDADNSAQALKTTSGFLYNVDLWNINTADAFLQLFDLAAGDVTVGTTTPTYVIPIPAGASGTAGAGTLRDYTPVPLEFKTAISYACTTTPAGAGDPTSGITLSATYK